MSGTQFAEVGLSLLSLEIDMPVLPSGRRIEFSLDRFHAMIEMLAPEQASGLVESLREPDDLLWVLDLVTFDSQGRPHFAECVASDWKNAALEWNTVDREAFAQYVYSETSRTFREEAIEGTRLLLMSRLSAEQAIARARSAA
jgi:hypothetical protein